jgi:hypothetical protein
MTLFPPITSSDAPGYETGYRGDGIFQQTALLADIAGFYRAHGLRAGGTERERLDHITVELEFMAVWRGRSSPRSSRRFTTNAEICSEMAALFLQDHLGCWAPAYGRRVATVSTSHWYRSSRRPSRGLGGIELDSEGRAPGRGRRTASSFRAPGRRDVRSVPRSRAGGVVTAGSSRWSLVLSVILVAVLLRVTDANPAMAQTQRIGAWAVSSEPGLDGSSPEWQSIIPVFLPATPSR